MIGYACDETPELLPREVILARRLNQFIYDKHPYDGKTQVTIAPDGSIDSIVASFQNVDKKELEQLVREFIKDHNLEGKLELHLNPAGDWHQGGFDADTGLTGRKLIVDNYGPRVAIGGGCYSGKDPSKVDRSAAYMARRIAVDYLRKRHAKEVLVRLAYAIGYAEPLEKTVIIDGKSEEIEGYDLTPNGIIEYLDLKRPIYEPTARYGHYGEGFDWDK
jgi:S-adenosylmethionine synthetase